MLLLTQSLLVRHVPSFQVSRANFLNVKIILAVDKPVNLYNSTPQKMFILNFSFYFNDEVLIKTCGLALVRTLLTVVKNILN